MGIFKMMSVEDEDSCAHFIQVGGWTHPLVPGASPCLQAENGAIMFPDIYSETPDSSVGLAISDSCEPAVRQQLLTHLEQLTAYKQLPQLGPEHQLGALGSSIVKGCELLASGIEVGAEKAGSLIEYVTEEGQKRLSKAEEDAKVGSLARNSVNVAKSATSATVKVSGLWLAEWASSPSPWPPTSPTRPPPTPVWHLETRSQEPWPTWWMQLEEVSLAMELSTTDWRIALRCLVTTSRTTPSRL